MAGKTINIQCRGADILPLDAIVEFQGGLKKRGKKEIDLMVKSIEKFGFSFPFHVWQNGGQNHCLDGHGRIQALSEMRRQGYSLPLFPVVYVEAADEAEAKNKLLRLNSQYGQMTIDSVLEFVDGIEVEFGELALPDGLISFNESTEDDKSKSLSDRFIFPPFSILNAREGDWQERKEAWISLGIKGSSGRGDNLLLHSDGSKDPQFYEKKKKIEKEIGRELSYKEFIDNYYDGIDGETYDSGTSIFDPVLAEILYKWFCPPSGVIVDPFAGGAVRGIVASHCGMKYIGVDLREEQVESNFSQIEIAAHPKPEWIAGDSRNIKDLCKDVKADFIFSCPPYADLEKYSDDERDISNLDYPEFIESYTDIIKKSCSILKDDRFACFVVGEVRDKKGNYYNFVSDTIKAFIDAGLKYYNEAILVTAIGSLAVRAGRIFSASRKIGKTHQNVLIFVKGDGKKAAKNCCDIDTSMINNIALGDD
jgi:hypothetical protein